MSFQNHPAIASYQTKLAKLKAQGHITEAQTRRAFGGLLERICEERDLLFVDEFPVGKNGRRKVDGAVRDTYSSLGYWEAKDQNDILEDEVKKKIAADYPISNTIFEDTQQAILWQNQKEVARFDLKNPNEIAQLLDRFFGFSESDKEGFESAVKAFVTKIPELARALSQKIEDESTSGNTKFKKAFDSFFVVCQTALNPNIKESAVKEMLVQHLLTERLFKKVFQNDEWFAHNVIAREIDEVIDALASRNWNRADFLKSLDPFFKTIEDRARTLPDYSSKQAFLNTVYERFFQGYSVETADTMGIVYTPQEIVDWMCASVEKVLQDEWGKSLATPGVQILDPCTGTGNFIVNLMNRIPRINLPEKYGKDLFANELMLLPYYVASGNIEHEYFERMGEYKAFEGLCFQDTLDMSHTAQTSMFAEKNTQRVARQKAADITVIVGNPPYNVGQKNENDNNKNRNYKGKKNEPGVDDLIAATYAKSSSATLLTKLYDPYVRFFKWASERLGKRDGVICFVSNNSFMHKHAFDGMRKELEREFHHIWHLDLGGDMRARESGNVFDITVGVGITILVKNSASPMRFIRYHKVKKEWRKDERLTWMAKVINLDGVEWQDLTSNSRGSWLNEGVELGFEQFTPLGTKGAKSSFSADIKTVFNTYATGVNSARDNWVYDFSKFRLARRINRLLNFYNFEVERWAKETRKGVLVDDFVNYDESKIKWSENLKRQLSARKKATYTRDNFRKTIYRPFCKKWLYFDEVMVDRRSLWPQIAPNQTTLNRAIVISDIGHRSPFSVLMTNCIPDLHLCATTDLFQCFPLYTYSVDGNERFDNITGFALQTARKAYGDSTTREDIFYATYALLHHPTYRTKYAENLKRDLPRLPLGSDLISPSDWNTLVEVGRKLGDLHVNYETAEMYPLDVLETTEPGKPFSFHIEKMRFDKAKTQLKVNDSIMLSGFTPEMFEYKLGNRSALDWVVESYRVKRDERSGLVSDPNRADDQHYIIDLVRRVTTVSLETQKLIAQLPPLFDKE